MNYFVVDYIGEEPKVSQNTSIFEDLTSAMQFASSLLIHNPTCSKIEIIKSK